jgi:hypothetical protein
MARSALGDAYAGSGITKRNRLEQIKTSLMEDRTSFDSHWRELGDWIMPRRIRFVSSDRNKGDRRNQNIIDSTARFSARTLASGLHAGLTSPARPWFKLTTPDPTLASYKPVKDWLYKVTQRMSVLFTDSNLYNSLPVVYGDLGTFGTACMSFLPDSVDLFRTYTYPIGSYWLGLDSRNLVSTFARDYELSVRQVVEEFCLKPGTNQIDWSVVSTTVKALWDRGNYQAAVPLTWIVLPNDDYDPARPFSQFLRFSSCHYEQGGESRDGRFLRESGYHSFPILAPRWEVSGEDTYGVDCPGMTALGDVKQLQSMQRMKGKAIHKAVDPPLVGHPELRAQKTSLLPGDITYLRDAQHGLRAIHEVGLNIEHLSNDIGLVQYRIQRAYFEDLFLMMARSDQIRESGQPLTAREVQERHEEKLLALGPVLERTNDELLDPIVDRAYQMMEDAGLFDDMPPPEELEGVKVKVEYISIMASAQKLVGVTGHDRFVASVVPLVEVAPGILHKVNFNKIVDDYAEMLGTDPEIVRTDEEAAQLAQAQATEQQATAMAERTQMLAAASRDAAAAQQATGASGTPPLDQVLGAGQNSVGSQTVM